ncbi:MAG: EpsG family protein [Candidatus Thiothrix putei]|uniref:EpsG family protein n=1 Tax=Candidatus Thiothrix putei TaxID=3080811 RepID=A0AA95KL23_9GAMM|nr:MAG: EpsG family protein [Candidatus Thiothrix putei]
MIIYYLLFIIPALIFIGKPNIITKKHADYLFFSIIAIFLIGYRSGTGGDWGNYFHQFKKIGENTLFQYIFDNTKNSHEFAFDTLFWLGYNYADFYLVMTVFAAFSFYALYYFAKNQPYFWLTVAIAVPFFVVIMVMGYTRQGLALSVLMIAIGYLAKGKPIYYLLGVIIATGFHNSAIVFSVLAIPSFFKMNKYRSIGLMIIFPAALIGSSFVEEYFSTKVQNYIVEAGYKGSYMSSSGAFIRILINAAAGSAFFLYRKQWQQIFPHDYYIWQLLSIATLASIPLMFLASSTSADRMALYLLMVQMAIWPRVIYMSKPQNRQLLMFGSIAAYGSILAIWLNYADNVWMWRKRSF